MLTEWCALLQRLARLLSWLPEDSWLPDEREAAVDTLTPAVAQPLPASDTSQHRSDPRGPLVLNEDQGRLLLFCDYPQLRDRITDPMFQVTDSQDDADVLLLVHHVKVSLPHTDAAK